MREIKFRAWDKKEKKIVPVRAVYFKDDRDKFKGSVIVSLEENHDNHDNINNFELMQFTGLKDKNGKEIYEGDIVANKRDWGIVIGQVMFYEGSFDIFDKEECYFNSLDQENRNGRIEVIGNVYENPELLVMEEEEK